MEATSKAEELGREHGTEAAEAWLDTLVDKRNFWAVKTPWPRPDANEVDRAVRAGWKGGASVDYYATLNAYEAAYGEAVRQTVRAKCQEGTL